MNATIEAPALFLSCLCPSIAVGLAAGGSKISSGFISYQIGAEHRARRPFHGANDTHCVGILSVTPKTAPISHLGPHHARHEAWSVGRQLNFRAPVSHLLGQNALHMFAPSLEMQPCEAIFVTPIPPTPGLPERAGRVWTKPWYPALQRAIAGSTSPHLFPAFGQIYSPKALF